MRIAIPTFGPRVSPRFDCAETFLFFAIDDGKMSDEREILASGWAPHERINRLLELGTEGVICGGIDWWSAESLRSAGIAVRAGIVGTVADALADLLRGDIKLETDSGSDGEYQRRRLGGTRSLSAWVEATQPTARCSGHHGNPRRRRRGAIN